MSDTEVSLKLIHHSTDEGASEPWHQLVVISGVRPAFVPYKYDIQSQKLTLTQDGSLEGKGGVLSLDRLEPGAVLSVTQGENTAFVIENEGYIATQYGLVLGSGIVATTELTNHSIPPIIVNVENDSTEDMYIVEEVPVGRALEFAVRPDSEISIFYNNGELVEKFEKLEANTTWFVDVKYSVTFVNESGHPVQVSNVNPPVATAVPDMPPNGKETIKTMAGSIYEVFVGKEAMVFVDPESHGVSFRATIANGDKTFIIRAPPRVTLHNTTSQGAVARTSIKSAPDTLISAQEKRDFTVVPNTKLTVSSYSKSKVALRARSSPVEPASDTVTIEANVEYDIIDAPAAP